MKTLPGVSREARRRKFEGETRQGELKSVEMDRSERYIYRSPSPYSSFSLERNGVMNARDDENGGFRGIEFDWGQEMSKCGDF